MIEISNISFKYAPSEKLVLNDVSLKIQSHEWIVLSGPSGSGKSTLAKVIAGHLIPQEGTIRINNVPSVGRPNKNIIVVHQSDDLFPWLRVEKQIQLAQNHENQAERLAILDTVKLLEYRSYFPYQLSGGMKKRLALARALAARPELLILDESFSSLDEALRISISKDLIDVWSRFKMSILQITHQEEKFDFLKTRKIFLSNDVGLKEIG